MKARVVGTNDVFADVEKVVINGATYMPEVLEFEVENNYDYVYTGSNVVDWGQVRIKAAISAMQAIITNWHNLDSGGFDEYKIGYTAVSCANALIKELESFNGGKPKLRVSKKKKLKVEVKKGEQL